MKYYLEITAPTIGKRHPVPSSSLEPKDKINLTEGLKLQIKTLVVDSKTSHVKVTLTTPEYLGGIMWVFRPHVRFIDETGALIERIPVTENIIKPSNQNGNFFKLPGYASTFYMNNPIIPGGEITWFEFTHSGERMPPNKQTVENILRIVNMAEPFFKQFKLKPILNSCYRPDPYNMRAGGASNSRHKFGLAIDFWVPGYTDTQLYRMFDPIWEGGLGNYSYSETMIHLDASSKRRWYY